MTQITEVPKSAAESGESYPPLTVGWREAAEILGIEIRKSASTFWKIRPHLIAAHCTVIIPGTKERRYVVERLRKFVLTHADCNE